MRNFIIFFFILSTFSVVAQDTELDSYLDGIARRALFKHAIMSAAVVGLEEGDVILDFNGEKALIPASSLKVVTTLSAIDLLEREYQYETKVAIDGKIDASGTLLGNLYVIGSGDPTLCSEKFDGIASFKELLKDISSAVNQLGIYCIDGDIIADESIFNSFPVAPTWQWNDLGNYYAAGAWGLNVLDNEYKIYFGQQLKEGKVPQLLFHEPKIPGLELQNEVSTGKKGSGDNAYIFGGPYNYIKRIVGTIPPGDKRFRIKGSIPDPPTFFAYYLQKELEKNGVQSNMYRSIFTKPRASYKRREIHKIYSPILSDIIKVANFESNNLYCESVLKTIGKLKHGEGSGGGGISAIRKNIRKKGVGTDGLQMEDGSGLSARNRVSTLFLARFLKAMSSSIGHEEAINYLPKAGYQGTVRGMFGNSKARGNVWVKSGSMNGVQSLTGYMKAKSGKWLAFSIIVNGHTEENRKVRTHLEQFLNKLYNLQ